MTQQEVYDVLAPYTPEGMNLTVAYTLQSWKGQPWSATFSCADIGKGIAEWGDTPEELLAHMFLRLHQRGKEAA